MKWGFSEIIPSINQWLMSGTIDNWFSHFSHTDNEYWILNPNHSGGDLVVFSQTTKPTSQSHCPLGPLVVDPKSACSCLRSNHNGMGANPNPKP